MDTVVDTVEKNQEAFTGQSKGFSSDGETYADAEELAWMLRELPVSPDAEVLDIATGTGEFARALSPMVGAVVGLDATDAMLEQGKKIFVPCTLSWTADRRPALAPTRKTRSCALINWVSRSLGASRHENE